MKRMWSKLPFLSLAMLSVTSVPPHGISMRLKHLFHQIQRPLGLSCGRKEKKKKTTINYCWRLYSLVQAPMDSASMWWLRFEAQNFAVETRYVPKTKEGKQQGSKEHGLLGRLSRQLSVKWNGGSVSKIGS